MKTDLHKPDLKKVIDLDTLEICEKKPFVGEWSNLGWTFRWTPECLARQLDYSTRTRTLVDLESELFNCLKRVKNIWISTSDDKKISSFGFIDLFISANSPSINPELDAFYFNINPVCITYLLSNPEATVIYHKHLTSKLRSPSARIIARYLIKCIDLDLSHSSQQQTPLESRENIIGLFYTGPDKPNRDDLSWKSVKKDYISAHLNTVKKALKLKELAFKTKGRNENMVCWFEFTINQPFEARLDIDIPQLDLLDVKERQPKSDIEGLKKKSTTASRGGLNSKDPKARFSWPDVSVMPEFIGRLEDILIELNLPVSVEDVLAAYEGNAKEQISKSVLGWISPLKRWLSGKNSPFRTASNPKNKRRPSSTASTNRRKVSQLIPFNPKLIIGDAEKNEAKAKIQACGTFKPQYDLEIVDFVDWRVQGFISHHEIHSKGDTYTLERWKSLFIGFCVKAADMPKEVKAFRSFPFSADMITDLKPFCLQVKRLPVDQQKTIDFVLQMFSAEHEGERYTPGKWQRFAWQRVIQDMKKFGVMLPEMHKLYGVVSS